MSPTEIHVTGAMAVILMRDSGLSHTNVTVSFCYLRTLGETKPPTKQKNILTCSGELRRYAGKSKKKYVWETLVRLGSININVGTQYSKGKVNLHGSVGK